MWLSQLSTILGKEYEEEITISCSDRKHFQFSAFHDYHVIVTRQRLSKKLSVLRKYYTKDFFILIVRSFILSPMDQQTAILRTRPFFGDQYRDMSYTIYDTFYIMTILGILKNIIEKWNWFVVDSRHWNVELFVINILLNQYLHC